MNGTRIKKLNHFAFERESRSHSQVDVLSIGCCGTVAYNCYHKLKYTMKFAFSCRSSSFKCMEKIEANQNRKKNALLHKRIYSHRFTMSITDDVRLRYLNYLLKTVRLRDVSIANALQFFQKLSKKQSEVVFCSYEYSQSRRLSPHSF